VSTVDTGTAYEKAKLGGRLTLGERPAVLVVDLSYGFTDPTSSLGGGLDAEVAATRTVLDCARALEIPVIFTTIAFQPNMKDCGLWAQKGGGLVELQIGTRWVEIDSRLDPQPDETIIVKKGASAFFGTNLTAILSSQRIDTVVLCGASTSGCIRATAIDLIQFGFPALVPRDCVGDRAQEPHESNLRDIDAKYADVVSSDDAIAYLQQTRAASQ
jgi:nicotinamidase-related amidase